MALRFNTIMRALLAGNSTPSVPSFYFNFSNPSNVTLGAAQARGTITSTQNAHITMSASLSRVVGVAPLYVNIDMTGTTSDLTANATHDLFYSVNWGDPDAGQWANGVQSAGLTDKNWSFGPVGGHVFETPGTYLVTPTSTDGVNSAAKPGYVTVLDPNVVYAGANTICISNTNNTVGIPSGCTFVNRPGDTDMTAALNAVIGTYGANNKRILLCKADTWIATDQLIFNNISGMTIGGYGTGSAPTFGSGTMVTVTPNTFATAKSLFVVNSGNQDMRICNLNIASNPSASAVAVNSTMSGMLLYKVEIRGCHQGFNVLSSTNPTAVVPDQVCLYECLVDNLAGMAFYDTPGVTATYSSSTSIFSKTAHGYASGTAVKLRANTVQALPTPIDVSGSMGPVYYISTTNYTADQFSLANSPGAGVVSLTSSGTCTVALPELHGGIGAYIGMTRGGIMGCYFDSCNKGEQTLRIPFVDRGHINNNYIARPNQQKNAIKINSVIHTYFPVWSEKFVVIGNEIDLRNGYDYDGISTNMTAMCSMVIGSGGNGGVGGEWVRNGIVESNLTHSSTGMPKNLVAFAEINCPNMTVRNNIADFAVGNRSSSYSSAYSSEMHFAVVSTSTADTTLNVNLYNNTLYSNLANAGLASFVVVNPGGALVDPDYVDVKGNIWYTPNRAATTYRGALYTTGVTATHITASNNTDTANNATVSPLFTVNPPLALTDWKPTAGSYAIAGSGSPITLRDFNNVTRVGTFNHMGAVLP